LLLGLTFVLGPSPVFSQTAAEQRRDAISAGKDLFKKARNRISAIHLVHGAILALATDRFRAI